MKSNWFRLSCSLVLIGLLIAACGGSTAPTQAPAATEAPVASGDKVKVVIFVGMGTGTDPDQVEAQNKLAEKFNSTHDKIEIEFLIVPHEESGERYLAMVAGGTAPQLVGPNGVSTVAQFFDTWADVSPNIKAENYDLSDFYGPAVSLNEYPDKNTGLPLGLYPSFIFYNKDLFDAAGLDYPTHDFNDKSWTLDKLREISMKLTLDKNGKNATDPDFDPENIVQWGFDDAWTDGRGALTMFGAPDVGRPTNSDYKTATFNSDEWVFGLKWLSDGIWKDYFIPNASVQSSRDSAGLDPFGPGAVAMFYSHTWFMSEGLNELPFEYDLAPLPFNQKGERVQRVHADNFTIPDSAAHKAEAWEVMKWLVAPEQIIEVCQVYGCIPARKSVEADFLTALKAKYPDIDHTIIFKSIDYLDNPNHESYVPEWGKVSDSINNAMSLIYAGEEKDAQKVADQTQAEIQKILDDYWASK